MCVGGADNEVHIFVILNTFCNQKNNLKQLDKKTLRAHSQDGQP